MSVLASNLRYHSGSYAGGRNLFAEEPTFHPDALASASHFSEDLPAPAWNQFIEFLAFGIDAEAIEAEGNQVPNPRVLRYAIRSLNRLRSLYPYDPPTGLIVDPHGSIVLQRQSGRQMQEIVICDEGKVQVNHFDNHRLVRSEWI